MKKSSLCALVILSLMAFSTGASALSKLEAELFNAASSGTVEDVEKFKDLALVGKVKIDAKNNSGQTALMVAVAGNSLAVVDAILKMTPNIRVKDNEGRTVLMYAAAFNNSAVTEKFAGYLTFDKDSTGKTALMYAVNRGIPSVVEAVLSVYGFNSSHLSDTDDYGMTALDYAKASDAPGKQKIIQILKDHGAKE